MGKKNDLTPIGDIVKNVFANLENKKTLSKEDVEEHWKAIAGEDALRHSRPAALRKGVLVLCVDSPTWMHNLTLRKRKLLKELKRTFGKDRISEIQFKIGEF